MDKNYFSKFKITTPVVFLIFLNALFDRETLREFLSTVSKEGISSRYYPSFNNDVASTTTIVSHNFLLIINFFFFRRVVIKYKFYDK